MICEYFLPFGRLDSFAVQKFCSMMQLYLFIFAFVAFAFHVTFKKALPRHLSRSLPPFFFQEFYNFRSYVQSYFDIKMLCTDLQLNDLAFPEVFKNISFRKISPG